jgi:CheY-like chemotaxis protein
VLAPKDSALLRSVGSFDGAVRIKHVTTVRAALKLLGKEKPGCLVCAAECIDPAELPDKVADDLADGRLPMIVYDADNRIHEDDAKWHRLLRGGRVRLVRSPERFVDQLAFVLHLKASGLPEAYRHVLQSMYQSNKLLEGKRALIVDDDMRNIFALSSVLEEYRMEIRSTDNGRDAIRMLDRDPEVDIVLMDIMMPEMDGLETMREIRKIPACRDLPIIAVTAKAMKGDRERCLEAGAWDYLSKPVDTEQLLGTLRAWLHR